MTDIIRDSFVFKVSSPEFPLVSQMDHAFDLLLGLSIIVFLNSLNRNEIMFLNVLSVSVYIYCTAKAKALFISMSDQDFIQQVSSVVFVPLGVRLEDYQIRRSRDGQKKLGHRSEFIPRDKIIDTIVMEVVDAYKVSSVVTFRIRKNANNNDDECISTGNYVLKPAFEKVRITYDECIRISKGIQTALKNSNHDWE